MIDMEKLEKLVRALDKYNTGPNKIPFPGNFSKSVGINPITFSESALVELMEALASQRPLFHSEADFQHALAWLIHERRPDLTVRLEYPLRATGEIDILITEGKHRFLIELKYKTTKVNCEHAGEEFNLRQHGAQPLGRYDYLKDICRIEKSELAGAAIFLTNEQQYWEVCPRGNGAAFSTAEAEQLENTILVWQNNQNVESIGKGRTDGLTINGPHTLHWRDYSVVKNSSFRYLMVHVNALVETPARPPKGAQQAGESTFTESNLHRQPTQT